LIARVRQRDRFFNAGASPLFALRVAQALVIAKHGLYGNRYPRHDNLALCPA
jgi:hypothetical protein